MDEDKCDDIDFDRNDDVDFDKSHDHQDLISSDEYDKFMNFQVFDTKAEQKKQTILKAKSLKTVAPLNIPKATSPETEKKSSVLNP